MRRISFNQNLKNNLGQLTVLIILTALFSSVLTGSILKYSFSAKVDQLEKELGTTVKIINQEEGVVKVVEEAITAVVSIVVTKDLPIVERYYEEFSPFQDDSFFRQFFGEQPPFNYQVPRYREKGTEEIEVSLGTGFVVSADGLIVTNKHVVSDDQANYTVITSDGQKIAAQILAKDPFQDLAILKTTEANLPFLPLGNSDNLQLGQSVIAIGNALGEFGHSVSLGIVSGLKRSVLASNELGEIEQLSELIQTDAAVNPGNSGGPLLNLAGEVVGVNVAVAEGAENIGFSLPVNLIKRSIDQVKKTGKIEYPFLGISYVMIDQKLKQEKGLRVDYGALISDDNQAAVVKDSPADKAGLRSGDIILEINDQKVNLENPLNEMILEYQVGDKIKLKILRQDQQMTLEAVLASWQ